MGADGGVFAFGDAVYEGSAVGKGTGTVVGIAGKVQSNAGYWVATSSGTVYAFGAAAYEGSASMTKLNAPIVGAAGTQQFYTCAATSPDTTEGYWLVGADGGVFSYGSATYEGSEGGARLSAPVVGIASGLQSAPSCGAR